MGSSELFESTINNTSPPTVMLSTYTVYTEMTDMSIEFKIKLYLERRDGKKSKNELLVIVENIIYNRTNKFVKE